MSDALLLQYRGDLWKKIAEFGIVPDIDMGQYANELHDMAQWIQQNADLEGCTVETVSALGEAVDMALRRLTAIQYLMDRKQYPFVGSA